MPRADKEIFVRRPRLPLPSLPRCLEEIPEAIGVDSTNERLMRSQHMRISNLWGADKVKTKALIDWFWEALCLPRNAHIEECFFEDAFDFYYDVHQCKLSDEDIRETAERAQALVFRNHSIILQQSQCQRNVFETSDALDAFEGTPVGQEQWDEHDSDYNLGVPVEGRLDGFPTKSMPKQPKLVDGDRLSSRPIASPEERCRKWTDILEAIMPGCGAAIADALDATYIVARGKTGAPESTKKDLLPAKRQAMAFLLADMKAVLKDLSWTKEWASAVRTSDLACRVMYISTSEYEQKHGDPITSRLIRLQSLKITLAHILYSWVPTGISELWIEQVDIFIPSKRPLSECPQGALTRHDFTELFNALHDLPTLIPTTSSPDCIFFLLNLPNFKRAWNYWLGPNLQVLGELQTLWTRKTVGSQASPDLESHMFHVIIRETMLYKKLKSRLNEYYKERRPSDAQRAVLLAQYRLEHGNDANLPHQYLSCRHCVTLPVDQHCSQVRYVEKQDLKAVGLAKGDGISLHPLEDCLMPGETVATTTKVHNPHDLNMQAIRKDPDIVKRCKQHIIVLVDAESPEPTEDNIRNKRTIQFQDKTGRVITRMPLDFVFFNMLPPDMLGTMREHGKDLSHMVPIRRGKKFEHYHTGLMDAGGGRLPSGGGPGDAYGFYTSQTAHTPRAVVLV
ncbi:hypothetical protein BDZ89DRAFT_1132690 [Hymenopellis radicata]|nr:hypothetical protein BDZ89DRAFT_1132690 [Hymenopellis radicata]